MAETKIKSGVWTTEFVTTLLSQLISTLVILGVIDPVDTNFWAEALTKVIFALVGLLTTLAYIRGRIELKKQEMSAS